MSVRLALAGNVLVRRLGRPGGAPVLALHGFGDDGRVFAPLAAQDLGPLEILAPDLPGSGASPPIAEPTIAGLAEAARKVATTLAPDRRIGLLAHSIGATVALDLVAAEPERVAALMSLEGNLTAEDAYLSGRAADHATADDFVTALGGRAFHRAADDPSRRRWAASFALCDPATVWALGRDAKRRSEGDAFGHAMAGLAARGLPTRYVWSRRTVPDATRAFLEAHDVPHHELQDVTHTITADAPGLAAPLIRDFFAPLLA
ncbi:alpha/beta fold hydrolase [Acuticoccus sp.]|uniref:alpha/beta fold hydrolase n=1 Tax=Acuticoccus sp. TaxID=1904378 RepID=UPI003B525CE5